MNQLKRMLLLSLVMSCYCGMMAQSVYVSPVENTVSLTGKNVVLSESWVKKRELLNTAYIASLDPDRLLHNFRVNAKLPSQAKPLEGWESPGIGLRGHFTGHYLSALSSLVERYDDPVLAARLEYMVNELHKCQQALGGGYLSAFPETEFDKLERGTDGIWAPYYTYHKIMQGLLDVYVRTGNRLAYQMVCDMTSYVEARMAKLDAATMERMFYTVQANPTNESGAMNDVLYRLYKVSHNPRHLQLAKIFDREWFVVPLAHNQDILSGLHANTHIVLVNGYAQRYTITGETKYRDAAQNFWNMLMSHHAYANGSSSGPRPNAITPTSQTSEHWGMPDLLSNTFSTKIAESCVSHNTQKLTSELFTWTQSPVYADSYMNLFYNGIMALQSPSDGTVVYHLPLGSPRQKQFLTGNDFRCCNGTSIEAFSSLNDNIYFRNADSIWINLYVPSQANWKDKNIRLTQQGNFPEDSVVKINVSTRQKQVFALHLFIPSWARATDVYINHQKSAQRISPLSYLNITRKWKDNDSVRLVFHYDFHIKRMTDVPNVIALFYGPQLLAFKTNSELVLKGSVDDILSHITKKSDGTFTLVNDGIKYSLMPFYQIDKESYGIYARIVNDSPL
jgi:DUF1680 family protein